MRRAQERGAAREPVRSAYQFLKQSDKYAVGNILGELATRVRISGVRIAFTTSLGVANPNQFKCDLTTIMSVSSSHSFM
jgi:hypothetical protein